MQEAAQRNCYQAHANASWRCKMDISLSVSPPCANNIFKSVFYEQQTISLYLSLQIVRYGLHQSIESPTSPAANGLLAGQLRAPSRNLCRARARIVVASCGVGMPLRGLINAHWLATPPSLATSSRITDAMSARSQFKSTREI